jgi:hypothetical protein
MDGQTSKRGAPRGVCMCAGTYVYIAELPHLQVFPPHALVEGQGLVEFLH